MDNEKSDLILIVDDTPQNLQILGKALEKTGYTIAVAMSGKQALEFVEQSVPDLILLDVMMPDLDGFDTCLELKKIPSVQKVPVIFLTARSEPEDILKGFESGGVDYVTKPFNNAELLARVKTHLELKHAREEIITLKGLVPVCSSCKSIRDDDGSWITIEEYLSTHGDLELTHSMCPTCIREHYPEIAGDILKD